MSDSIVTTEVRCPQGSKGLLCKLIGDPKDITDLQSLKMQHHCRECTKDLRDLLGRDKIERVLHLYTITGEFLATQVKFRDEDTIRTLDQATQERLVNLAYSFRRH